MRKKMTMAKGIGIAVVAAVLILIVATHGHKSPHPDSAKKKATQTSPLVHATNSEEVRYLTAEVNTVIAQNKVLQQESAKVKKRLQHSTNDKMYQQQQQNNDRLTKQTENLARLQGELAQLKNNEPSDYAQTDRHSASHHQNFPLNGASASTPGNTMITTVTDLALPPSPTDKPGADYPPILPTAKARQASGKRAAKAPAAIPYFTIPANATLGDVVLQSDIVGEVPVNGTLLSPAFQFKAIVGRKALLASNGLTLPPDLNGIVLEGYSIGNMALSCARGYITRMLFTWSDGTFTVIGQQKSVGSLNPTDTLGYIATPYGNPCIKGQYLTDAPKVLASMAALAGASGWAKAISQAETTTQSSSYGTMSAVTGNANKYAGGKALGAGADSALAWYTSRVHDISDVIYIPASIDHTPTQVSINITQTLAIDKPINGRRLDYGQTQADGVAHHTMD